MATIRMRKGDLFADINKDPECVKNAQKEGWSLVEEPESEGGIVIDDDDLE